MWMTMMMILKIVEIHLESRLCHIQFSARKLRKTSSRSGAKISNQFASFCEFWTTKYRKYPNARSHTRGIHFLVSWFIFERIKYHQFISLRNRLAAAPFLHVVAFNCVCWDISTLRSHKLSHCSWDTPSLAPLLSMNIRLNHPSDRLQPARQNKE